MPDFSERPPTQISPDSHESYKSLLLNSVSIICGRNNSGKSFILRKMLRELGKNATYLGPQRYQNFNVLSPYGPQANRKENKYQQQLTHFSNERHNIDNSPFNLQQAIAELSDERREKLFEVMRNMLNADLSIKHTIPDNSMSQMYIDVDGYNLSFTSSGVRLIASLVTSLLDTDYTHFLIDEPELGISPEVQTLFAEWLLNDKNREKYLSHVEIIILATHSPIFLNRIEISKNYWVEKNGDNIIIDPLRSIADLNRLQFRLLGNRFETLFLPSAIIIVEGKTDFEYLRRLVSLRYEQCSVSVIPAHSDAQIGNVIANIKQMLGDIRRSPYADRIFVVLDAVHGHDLPAKFQKQGIPAERILIWENNGIEYLYPQRLLREKFGAFERLTMVDGDRIFANQLTVTKNELSSFVVDRLSKEEVLPVELEEKLFNPLSTLLF
ncbi:MAG: AAA family ATPase [Alphaproteobacteria bacterium]